MKVTFAGIPLGIEPPQGGLDYLQGFALPKETPEVQIATGLRSPDAEPIARMNIARTISGVVIYNAGASFGAAMAARMQFSSKLAFYGALVIVEDANVTTFAQAVRGEIEIVKDVSKGVSYGLQFTFHVGPPQQQTLDAVLGTGTGNSLGVGDGSQLGTGI